MLITIIIAWIVASIVYHFILALTGVTVDLFQSLVGGAVLLIVAAIIVPVLSFLSRLFGK